MKLFKDYKGVVIMYFIITMVSVLWIVNYQRPNEVTKVKEETKVVKNY